MSANNSTIAFVSVTLTSAAATHASASSSSSFQINAALNLIATSAIVGTVGVVTNGIALVIIFGFTTIWKRVNFYLLVNQIAIDFATCTLITCQYFTLIHGDPNSAFFNIKLINDAACRLWYSRAWMWSFFVASNYNVVMVTFERYLKLVHPITYHNHITKVRDFSCFVTRVMWPPHYLTYIYASL